MDSPLDRAAILILCMGEGAASKVLGHMAPQELVAVAHAMSRAGGMRRDRIEGVLRQFFDEYREQSGVHAAPRSFLQRSLGQALGEGIASSVLDGIYGDRLHPKMARLQWLGARRLAHVIADEHRRMQALFLAFLPPGLAAEVVAALPEAQRDALLVDTARLTKVDPEWLCDLEAMVDRCLDGLSTTATEVEGVRLAAEIIGRVPNEQARMVEAMRQKDAKLADAIEANMYEFYMLAHQSDVVMASIVSRVPLQQWAVALKGAELPLRNAVVAMMPRLQADSLDEMMMRLGPLPVSRVREERSEIMRQVRELADVGEITLRLYAEEVVE